MEGRFLASSGRQEMNLSEIAVIQERPSSEAGHGEESEEGGGADYAGGRPQVVVKIKGIAKT
jgi:hypothetical protein